MGTPRCCTGPVAIPAPQVQQDYTYKAKWATAGEYKISIQCDAVGGIDKIEKTVYVVDIELDNPKGDATKNPTEQGGAADGVNEFTFDTATPGVCDIACRVTVGMTLNDSIEEWGKANILWDMAPGIGEAQASWLDKDGHPGDYSGIEGKMHYVGLPTQNSSFGTKTVTMSFAFDDSQTTVDDPQTATIQVFFNASTTTNNHPSDSYTASWPNWLYYYAPTVTLLGSPPPQIHYIGAGQSGHTIGDTFIEIANDAISTCDVPYGSYNPLSGIDSCAWTLIHESQHYYDQCRWWSNNAAYWSSRTGQAGAGYDMDGDCIPNELEDLNGNGQWDPPAETYDWQEMLTPGFPAAILTDFEDVNCRAHAATRGNHSLDWGNKGFQHATNDVWD